MAQVYGAREVAQSTKTWPHPVTAEHARWRISNWRAADPAEESVFVMVLGGDVIGSVGAARRHDRTYSIGYGVHRAFWGQGLTTEAVGALCSYVFRVLRADATEADVFQDNPASSQVALKLGFRPIGDIGPGWSTTLGGNFPRFGYRLKREWFVH